MKRLPILRLRGANFGSAGRLCANLDPEPIRSCKFVRGTNFNHSICTRPLTATAGVQVECSNPSRALQKLAMK
ncbi:unnamed protein product, partial [Nesidiocoris tenuis]